MPLYEACIIIAGVFWKVCNFTSYSYTYHKYKVATYLLMCLTTVLEYYFKLITALNDAISSTDSLPQVEYHSLYMCYHKIRTFTFHCMCECIGIRLNGYGQK